MNYNSLYSHSFDGYLQIMATKNKAASKFMYEFEKLFYVVRMINMIATL